MAVTDARFRRHLQHGGDIALLAYIDHPDGEARYWSRAGTLQWDGFSWIGVGTLGKVSGVTKTTALDIKQITFQLFGMPPASTQNLSARVRNRSCKLWLAAVHRNRVVGEPYTVIDDLMDFQTLKVNDDGSVNVEITVNVGFWSIERAINKAWTHEEQQVRFPGDSGLSQIPLLADKQTNWRKTA